MILHYPCLIIMWEFTVNMILFRLVYMQNLRIYYYLVYSLCKNHTFNLFIPEQVVTFLQFDGELWSKMMWRRRWINWDNWKTLHHHSRWCSCMDLRRFGHGESNDGKVVTVGEKDESCNRKQQLWQLESGRDRTKWMIYQDKIVTTNFIAQSTNELVITWALSYYL